ncbi:MAG: ATP-binding protein [Chloroflexi bacterium]|nr:ATP-binding protein [Chloroflexota bacterium]
MTNDNQSILPVSYRTILDGLGDGVLLFDMDGKLLFDNHMARKLLGSDLVVIRSEGWEACAMMMDAGKSDEETAEEIRARAIRQSEPVRFHMLISNAYTPCWACAVHGDNDDTFLMISIEQPDWAPLTELMNTFRSEASMAIGNTKNHADLIVRLANSRPPDMTTDQLAQRILGFSELMSQDMYRLQNLLEQLHRLEMVRTGQMIDVIKKSKRDINVRNFVEDLLEDITEKPITDTPPKTDLRDRIDVDIPGQLAAHASKATLDSVMRDVLRNAVMYSEADSTIKIRARSTMSDSMVVIEVEDLGYGIREKEQDRVFKPFQRARQPQIIAEFGYGLSLYLSKANVEMMSGKMWFSSEEGVGTTFFIQLPAAQVEEEAG